MKTFCTGRRFLLNSSDGYSEIALTFLHSRAKDTGVESNSLAEAEEKIGNHKWKHREGIFLTIGLERWSTICNASLLPHLELRYDTLLSKGIPDFNFQSHKAGEFFQSDQGTHGDAFFGFVILVVLGILPDGGVNVHWPEAKYDLTRISDARDGFVKLMKDSQGLVNNGMLIGTVHHNQLSELAETWISKINESPKRGEWFNDLLDYLKISRDLWWKRVNRK